MVNLDRGGLSDGDIFSVGIDGLHLPDTPNPANRLSDGHTSTVSRRRGLLI